MLGRPDRRDYYVDYASAHALTHGLDAYANSNVLFHGLGPAWNVAGPNPHPPTLLTLVLPFTALHYGGALAAWALLMIFGLIATLRLVGVPVSYSIGIGVAVGLTFPGAYGIGNPVPVIGLGVAVAYRYRTSPVLAGLGIALAAIPKGTGLVLVLPFLVAGRVRTVLYAAGFYLLAALVPVLGQSNVWQRYLEYGTKSITANATRRNDNGSLVHLAYTEFGWSDRLTLALLAVVTVAIALAQRDLFWAPVWAMVAALPVAWMYSLLTLLTLLPLLAWAAWRSPRRTGVLVALGAGLTLGSPPLGLWPPVIYPIVLLIAAVVCVLARPPVPTLWFGAWLDPVLRRHHTNTDRISADEGHEGQCTTPSASLAAAAVKKPPLPARRIAGGCGSYTVATVVRRCGTATGPRHTVRCRGKARGSRRSASPGPLACARRCASTRSRPRDRRGR